MYSPFPTVAILVMVLLWAAGIALALLLLWLVIRSAVRRALWDHYQRTGGAGDTNPPRER